VRDVADMTRYIFDMLVAGERNFRLFEGDVKVNVDPENREQALELAGSIAFVEGWAHEITTWGDGIQDASSFSPEDFSSNMVGIETGKRAVRRVCNGQDFNANMDEAMQEMMKELDAQPAYVTAGKRRLVEIPRPIAFESRWFKETFGKETLIRRNFDAAVWTIPAGGYRKNLNYLNAAYYAPYFGNFNYTIMRKDVPGYEGTWVVLAKSPESKGPVMTLREMTEALRKEWLAAHPGMDQWPKAPPLTMDELHPTGAD